MRPETAVPPAPPSHRLILTLAVAGLLSGLAIVGIYETTLPRITANKARALRRAVFEVLPGSENMKRVAWRDGELVETETGPAGEPEVYAGYSGAGGLVGYAVPGDGAGFQDNIRLLYGYDPVRRKIVGMRILESRETPGLGDRIFKDPDFVANFQDLAPEPAVVLVKGGRTAPNEVDAITGATISSNAVVKIINATNEVWLPRITETSEPPGTSEIGADDGSGGSEG